MNPNYILADYFQGAYGPTLIFVLSTKAQLMLFRELIAGLEKDSASSIDLKDWRECILTGTSSVRLLRSAGKAKAADKSVVLETTATGEVSILWCNAPEGWTHILELLAPFENGSESGHQYLSVEGVDDILIELSYREGLGGKSK